MLRRKDRKMSKVQFHQLENLKIIGAGSFAKVSLVRHKEHYMALKTVRKSFVEANNYTAAIVNERNILCEMRDCAFIIHLHRTYRTEKYVHFLLELCVGGDAFAYSRKRQTGKMPEENAIFIAACVKEGLQYIHSRNYVFRDLKEENILIDANGYCKISDFGYCIEQQENLTDFAGTITHMAPEIVTGKPYDRAVDLWAFGITIYGLLTKQDPFTSEGNIQQEIVSGKLFSFMPWYLRRDARALIRALSVQDPKQRLGYNSMEELEQNAWFSDFDWLALRALSMESPIHRIVDEPCNVQFKVDKATLLKHTFKDDIDDGPPRRNSGWDADF